MMWVGRDEKIGVGGGVGVGGGSRSDGSISVRTFCLK